MSSTYSALGASATKDEVKAAIAGLDRGLFPGAFCNLRADGLGGDPASCLAIHADGAGTKSIVAYLAWRETGSLEPFAGIAQDSTVMNIDDLACVGATGGFLLSNTIGRNAHRIPGAVITAVLEGYRRFAERMAALGVGIELGGGETADVGDLVATLIADSTVVVRLPRAEVVDASQVKAGHLIVGLSSTGQARYEDRPNSGIGSNGLSSARHLLLARRYAEAYPEICSTTLGAELAYSGRHLLSDPLPQGGMTVGEALLSPTRTYVPILREILRLHRADVSGIVHCSGGGQAKCRSFGRGLRYVKDQLFDVPPLFRAIQETGKISAREMYQVFNMGHRMEVYCEPSAAPALVELSRGFGVEARVVGRVEASGSEENEVLVLAQGEEFRY